MIETKKQTHYLCMWISFLNVGGYMVMRQFHLKIEGLRLKLEKIG